MHSIGSNKRYFSHLIKLEVATFSKEVEPEVLFDGLGFDLNSLDDPYFVVTESQNIQFHRNLLKCIEPSLAGMRIAQAFEFSDLGPIGHILGASSNFEETNSLLLKFKEIVHNPIEFSRSQDEEFIYWVHESYIDDETLYRFYIERSLASQAKFIRLLFSNIDELSYVCFRFKDNGDKEALEHYFGCEVRFSQAQNMIVLPYVEGGGKANHSDARLRQALMPLIDSMICELQYNSLLASEIHHLLMECQGEFPLLIEVASKVGMSERTASRKLKQEGVTYQALLDDVRRLKAINYLRNDTMTVQTVSELCGFKDVKSFVRSFKRWTGESPSTFKKC